MSKETISPLSYEAGKEELIKIQKKIENNEFNMDELEELIDRGKYLIEYLTDKLKNMSQKLDDQLKN